MPLSLIINTNIHPSTHVSSHPFIHPLFLPSIHLSIHGDKNYRMTFTRQWITRKEEKFSLPLKDIPVGNEDKIANSRGHSLLSKITG